MRAASWLVIVGLLSGGVGCGGDEVNRNMGARCADNGDCATKCLLPGDEYPGGMCTELCVDDGDCPSDANCATREGGVCLYSCRVDDDCAFLDAINGRRWTCQADEGAGDQTVMVCLGAAQ